MGGNICQKKETVREEIRPEKYQRKSMLDYRPAKASDQKYQDLLNLIFNLKSLTDKNHLIRDMQKLGQKLKFNLQNNEHNSIL